VLLMNAAHGDEAGFELQPEIRTYSYFKHASAHWTWHRHRHETRLGLRRKGASITRTRTQQHTHTPGDLVGNSHNRRCTVVSENKQINILNYHKKEHDLLFIPFGHL